jgi:hypothetical protein
MELLGFFLVVGALLILLLLGMLVLESAVKLRLAWKFRKTVENACLYPAAAPPRRSRVTFLAHD